MRLCPHPIPPQSGAAGEPGLGTSILLCSLYSLSFSVTSFGSPTAPLFLFGIKLCRCLSFPMTVTLLIHSHILADSNVSPLQKSNFQEILILFTESASLTPRLGVRGPQHLVFTFPPQALQEHHTPWRCVGGSNIQQF